MPRPTPEQTQTQPPVRRRPRGTGPESAGQSGDTQGLPDVEDVQSESVTELAEEGQYVEASIVDAVENAADADADKQKKVPTKEVREDDVPAEYWNPDI